MKSVIINEKLCIGCEKCVKDCVSEKLSLKNGKAQYNAERCILCGHCYAICPVNAVTLTKYGEINEEKVSPHHIIDSDNLLSFMKSRRSIRRFTKERVSEEDIAKILEAGRYCPTGTNAQDFSFTVITDSLADLEKDAVSIFRKAQKIGGKLSAYIRNSTIDDNFFFKGAPLVIVVNGKGKTSSCLASSYMELMAESLGLGVLYSGFFIAAAKLMPKISKKLPTPDGHDPVTCLVIGHPDVKYERIPPRNEAEINRI
ncbi:MAG: nitroreductase family protein [Clostridia bacterium]|nr:nitroreductase family protein [Clostridia bacterium]